MRAKTLILVLGSLAAGLAACGGSQPSDSGSTIVAGYGLRVELPPGWSGRVFRPSPKDAVSLEATSAALPPVNQVMTIDGLTDEGAYVRVDDIGAPPPRIERSSVWLADPRLPLAVGHADLAGPYEGGFPSGTALNVVIHDRALMIRVRFGSQPSDDRLDDVNEVLASLSVAEAQHR